MRRLLLLAMLLPVDARPAGVPALDERQAERDPDFRSHAGASDLRDSIRFLYHHISDPPNPQSRIGGIDLFVTQLEHSLSAGSDLPRALILQNSLEARNALRLAYNDLLKADSAPLLPDARDAVKEAVLTLKALLERNRASIQLEKTVADAGRATAEGMSVTPADSAAGEVPVARLCAIASIEPAVKALQQKLGRAAKTVQKAKALIQLAKDRSAALDALAAKAGQLDDESVRSLENGGARAGPQVAAGEKVAPIRSQKVIKEANDWLKQCVQTGEQAVAALEAELDPRRDGIAKALAAALESDVRTMNARVAMEKSGQRINFNHILRMHARGDAAIAFGWSVSAGPRRAWWEGRAQLARGESLRDAERMAAAAEEAEQAAPPPEEALQAAIALLVPLERALGPSQAEVRVLEERTSSIPVPRDAPPPARPVREQARSEGIKVPNVLAVTQEDLQRAFDLKAVPQ